MEVIILKTPKEVARRGADYVAHVLQSRPAPVLGLATGSTPVAMYQELIHRHKAGKVTFHKTITFNLDEYVGLPTDHTQSYRTFMDEHLFSKIDIELKNTHVPDGTRENPMEVGPEYEHAIHQAGGLDIQVLGIGRNGHIGFNEPTSSLTSRTRVKTLNETTIKDNSRFFEPDETQPTMAITMGIGTIMEARRILLLATGKNKAKAIAQTIEGPITAMCPASILQMHNSATVILDEEAASQLTMKDYYHHVLSVQDDLVRRFGDPR